MNTPYDLIVIGSGAAGQIAAITAARNNKKVLLCEQLPKLGIKLKATGGGRCNLTNTLENESFMKAFGANGRFLFDALKVFDHKALQDFFHSINIETHSPDGFRVFPVTHSSNTILNGLEKELENLGVTIKIQTKLQNILTTNNKIVGVETSQGLFYTSNVLLATGGLGYPKLGATGEGIQIARNLGHTITELYPAMMPLYTKESWQENCTADTIAKATIKVNVDNKKLKKLQATGDLIFTKNGLRGPVILDFAREITPFLKHQNEVPILVNMTGKNEDEIINYLKKNNGFGKLLPPSVLQQLCKMCDIPLNANYKDMKGIQKNKLVKLLAWTPFTIVGHDGFEKAMITRGGVSTKQIDPKTMQSKLIDGLYFAGEIVDIDGPCGGYNLQWAFSSGYVAGSLL
jgi:predicted Rossmann fold flavoprotein